MAFGDRHRIEALDGRPAARVRRHRPACRRRCMNELPRSLKVVTVWLLVGMALFRRWCRPCCRSSRARASRSPAATGRHPPRPRRPLPLARPRSTTATRWISWSTPAPRAALPAELARRLQLPVVGRHDPEPPAAWRSTRSCAPTWNPGAACAPGAWHHRVPALATLLLGMDVCSAGCTELATDGELIFDHGHGPTEGATPRFAAPHHAAQWPRPRHGKERHDRPQRVREAGPRLNFLNNLMQKRRRWRWPWASGLRRR